MPTFKTCAVILKGSKEVYRKGEHVEGNLILDVNDNVTVKAVRAFLYGQTLVKWDELALHQLGGTQTYMGKEKYHGWVNTLFGKKQNESGPNQTLTAGRHNYKFKFILPSDGLPSSFEGEYGAIRYWIKIEIDKPFPGLNQCWYRGLTILDDININDRIYKNPVKKTSEKQVSKALGFGDAGNLSLMASTDRAGYCAGEKIALTVVAKNNTTKDMGKLKAELVQKVVFMANSETKTRETVIRILEGSEVLKGEERAWKSQLLEIDAVPPTTKSRSCHIIIVSYYVKVVVQVPYGFNLNTILPITIGTIPFGYLPTRNASAQSFEIDASPAITYTKCNRGIIQCRKSDGQFPNYNYNPMCAYVLNYTYPPTARQPSATASRPTANAATSIVTKPSARNAQASATTSPQAWVQPTPLAQATPVMPPSYNDVIRMDNGPNTIVETAVEVKPEKFDKPYGILLIRFPDIYIQQFRDSMEELNTTDATDGELIALSVQPITKAEMWPTRTSVAVLKFDSVNIATDWFNNTPNVVNSIWSKSCDAMVGTMSEQYREGNMVYIMTKARVKKGTAKSKITRFAKLYASHLRPLRMSSSGVNLVFGKNYTTLKGSWLDEGWSWSVTQWDSLKSYFMYRFTKENNEQYKECNELLELLYEIDSFIVFKSEDLSLFKVSLVQSTEHERADSPALELRSQSNSPVPEGKASKLEGESNEPVDEAKNPVGETNSPVGAGNGSVGAGNGSVSEETKDADSNESGTDGQSEQTSATLLANNFLSFL